jgi:DNA modification methylase
MTGSARVVRGDALRLPLPDSSVDLVVTSPPYWVLRSYTDGGEHYSGQLGSEPTVGEFVAALLAATREMVRVLKPTGSIFVNLGDKYSSPGGQTDHGASSRLQGRRALRQQGRPERPVAGVPVKSLVGIPWRYAIACIDDLGLTLRQEIIWSKVNGIPESVTDRCRRSHEQWFHFTRGPRYYAAVDALREPYRAKTLSVRSLNGTQGARGNRLGSHQGADRCATQTATDRRETLHPLGALPGSVWEIPTQPLRVPVDLGVDHYAAFPVEWPLRLVLGYSPPGICTACGAGRRLVVEAPGTGVNNNPHRDRNGLGLTGSKFYAHRHDSPRRVTGHACDCPTPDAPTRPAVVLDPFGGTGTTALAAKVLGRQGISVDMSADYCRLATWRVNDADQIAAARARARQHGAQTPLSDTDDLGLLADLFTDPEVA